MKENREVWMFSFINGRGVFQETKFDADADKITEFYRENGYIRANVGVPEQKFLSDSSDGKTRWIELRIPVTEGRRYKVGDVEFTGNTIVKTEYLKPLFKLNSGDFYNEKNVRKGMEKAREVYGGGGYWEFTGFPDYKFHDDPNPAEAQAPQALAAPVEPGPAIVDVTMRLQEGQQYFVNRITFVGNSTTHDTVIRRADAAGRGRRLQHRGAEVEHQAGEPARVLQAARGRQGHRRPEDRRTRRTRWTYG